MYYKNPLTYLIPFLFIVLLFTNLIITQEQQFVLLAKSFLQGSLAFTNIGTDIGDTALFEGKYYWPHGPFPTLIIIPFLLIFKDFYQGFIQFPLSILNFYLIYKIAKILKLDHKRSLLIAIFFVFGSTYTPVAAIPATAYYAQTVATTLLVGAIYLFFTKRNYFLIALLVGLATACRFTLIFTSVFFLYFLIKSRDFKNTSILLATLLVILTSLAYYNYARFKNPFESGYNIQVIAVETQLRRNEGLFSIAHVPGNIFYMLFKGPDPILKEDGSYMLKWPFMTFDTHGLSLLFLSPILFFIKRANFKEDYIKAATLAIIVGLIPVLTYYGLGQRQVGYRYALDFFPFAALLVADASRKLNIKLIYCLVLFGVFFSIFFTFLYMTGLQNN